MDRKEMINEVFHPRSNSDLMSDLFSLKEEDVETAFNGGMEDPWVWVASKYFKTSQTNVTKEMRQAVKTMGYQFIGLNLIGDVLNPKE